MAITISTTTTTKTKTTVLILPFSLCTHHPVTNKLPRVTITNPDYSIATNATNSTFVTTVSLRLSNLFTTTITHISKKLTQEEEYYDRVCSRLL